ncbi:MAG TPA: long-chain-acyl-CoA synthetase [Roseiarcus sp.]|nr:long-chain-acyl-CoA synthetase [Roseiarcus sp.]
MNDSSLLREHPASTHPSGPKPADIWRRALEATARLGGEPARILPVVVNEFAQTRGENPALLSDRETFSFAALADRMNRYSRWALGQGIAAGDAVCLLMPNRPDYVAIWLGVTQIGGVVALLNANLSGAALAHCVDAAAPRHIIVAAELAQGFAEAAPHLKTMPRVWLHGDADLAGSRLEEAIQRLDGAPLSRSERRSVTLADRALLIYTSGTTGLPKAANVSHHRIMTWSCWFAAILGVEPADRMYDCLPLYHSVGGVVAIGSALVNGGSVFVAERFSARQFWDDVARWDCTLFQYIGELCRYLLAAPPHPAEKAHRLRAACGNGLSADVWVDFQNRFGVDRIVEFYAATEANFSLTNVEGKVGAIGRLPGFLAARSRIALVRFDVEKGEPARGADGFCIRAERGEAGEAIGKISSGAADLAGRFEGYTNAAETEKKVLRNVFAPGDAWLRSGDLMRMDAEGFYYFVDRVGDTFRWKGENVSTLEVANALRACPGVADATVYGVAVPGAEGRAGMALIVGGDGLDLDRLRRFLAEALPPYARPLFLRIRPDIEVTATFKHQKQALMRDGFDPSRIADPLYVFDREKDAYIALDREVSAAIASGAMRL